MNRYGTKARVGQWLYMEVRRITEQHTRHRDGASRRAKRYNRDPRIEAAHEFLQHENGASDGRVECRRKSGTRARSQKHLAVILVAAKYRPQEIGHARSHLHTRSFATQREAGADCEYATNELHRYQAIRCLRQLSAQDSLDVGNAAAGCLRCVSANQPGCNAGGNRTNRGDEQKPHKLFAVRPGNQRVAEAVRLIERKTEDRP